MIVTLVLLLLAIGTSSGADVYSSLATMKMMISARQDIPIMINNYIDSESHRLKQLKKLAQEIQVRNDETVRRDPDEVIAHPINAFQLLKNLLGDWEQVMAMMRNNLAEQFIRNVTRQRETKRHSYPTQEDLDGAAIGMLRLQDTYRMDTHDIANGKILNSKMRTVPLAASDCFEIGRAAYNAFDYYHTVLWMQEARERVRNELPPSTSIEDILEYLAFSLYKQNNLKRALQLTDELYQINPNHPRAKGNMKWYEDLLEEEGVRRVDMRRKIPPLTNPRHDGGLEHNERDIYEALCRNEVPVSMKALSRLYCYYKMDRPYLRLAPIKVEIARQNPMAVLFHDIMSDEEAKIVEMLSIPRLNRATVQNSVTGNLEAASYRISKSAWLKAGEHEVVDRINRRLDLATNLEMETAEELQVQNYGVGGHYDPHFDCARKEETNAFKDLGTGNRIATILIYMTEPEIGGRTVFTDVKTSVPCTKNAALFWYNLMRNGEVDVRSRHAACPVLTGTKWVTNKWIHEIGQEFRRPCGLNQFDQERYVGDLGAPEPMHYPNIRSWPIKQHKKLKKH